MITDQMVEKAISERERWVEGSSSTAFSRKWLVYRADDAGAHQEVSCHGHRAERDDALEKLSMRAALTAALGDTVVVPKDRLLETIMPALKQAASGGAMGLADHELLEIAGDLVSEITTLAVTRHDDQAATDRGGKS